MKETQRKEEENKLKPKLGLFSATAISVGAIIGGGIFIVTGIVAGLAGSAMVISMLIAATIALFSALSYSELAGWQPAEGSVYDYACQLISPFSGFLAGWMWVISNSLIGAAVALGFGYYLNAAFPALPPNIVAAIMVLTFTLLNIVGIRKSAILNNVLVATKLLVLAFFVLFGALYIDAANFVPFVPVGSGVFYGAYVIFFAYCGFGRVAVVSEEVKNAKRNVPRALLLSLIISTVFYVFVGIVAVGLIGPEELSMSTSPLTDAMSATGSQLAAQIISIGGLLAMASVLLTSVLGVSRMTFSMARRKDLPQILSRIHSKYDTPHYSIWIIGGIIAVIVLFADIAGVVVISTFASLFYYALANLAAFKLETKRRLYPKFIPILGLISCLSLLALFLFSSTQSWIIGVAILLIGTIYYFVKQKIQPKKKQVCA
ncbi:amino acid permease [Candidatus Bathyarchaeota archaeon]|nr:amino acid permease [Candidatus Bathyarchaeota archaeon]